MQEIKFCIFKNLNDVFEVCESQNCQYMPTSYFILIFICSEWVFVYNLMGYFETVFSYGWMVKEYLTLAAAKNNPPKSCTNSSFSLFVLAEIAIKSSLKHWKTTFNLLEHWKQSTCDVLDMIWIKTLTSALKSEIPKLS